MLDTGIRAVCAYNVTSRTAETEHSNHCRNLLPYLTGKNSKAPHDSLYWRFGRQMALRMGDWKIVKAPEGGMGPGELTGKATTDSAQLYNSKEDIGETQNLPEKNPDKLKELAKVWQKWDAQMVETK